MTTRIENSCPTKWWRPRRDAQKEAWLLIDVCWGQMVAPINFLHFYIGYLFRTKSDVWLLHSISENFMIVCSALLGSNILPKNLKLEQMIAILAWINFQDLRWVGLKLRTSSIVLGLLQMEPSPCFANVHQNLKLLRNLTSIVEVSILISVFNKDALMTFLGQFSDLISFLKNEFF